MKIANIELEFLKLVTLLCIPSLRLHLFYTSLLFILKIFYFYLSLSHSLPTSLLLYYSRLFNLITHESNSVVPNATCNL